MFDAEQRTIEARIGAFCTENGLPEMALNWTPIPFSGQWGISTSFFQLAAADAKIIKERSGQGVNVPQHAQEIAARVAAALGTPAGFARVEAVKGYLNLYFDTAEFARRVVREAAFGLGKDFGRGASKGERVMVEYAQPNTHHSFHIGHARNAILGEALARIVEFAGFDTVRASYPGDIGLGVITVLWMYDKFYRGQEPEGIHTRGQWLLKLYVEATRLLEKKENETPEESARREAYDAERREMYRKWDAGDPTVRDLWLKTREWSLDELRDILKTFGIDMDVWFYESEVDDSAKAIVETLIAKGIADDERPSGGAVIVKIDEKLGLKKEKYRTNIVLRSDGTTLYLTKDLALAKEKFEKYHVDRSIYVVDVRQSLHLQQAFAILRLMGFPQAEKCYHLGYGFVSLPEGAMSARRGRVVLFKDVLDEAVRRVLTVIAEKNPGMPEEDREEVARQVGLGALVYSMLSVDNNRDMVFDMNEALNFDGHTGPYIQYAHVRCNSILRKHQETPMPDVDEGQIFRRTFHPTEIQLIDLISRFPGDVQRAAAEYKPLTVASAAYELARAFNDFYDACPVLKATVEERASRIEIVQAAKQTIANALKLLAIQAPETM
ncbi:MAG: arginine--tRNA ligase [Chloroflexota bacterium]